MTNSRYIFLLPLVLTVLLLTSNAVAQSTTSRSVEIGNETATSESITAARSEHTNTTNAEGTTRDPGDNMQLAQFSRRPPRPHQHAHPPVYRQPPRMDYGGNGHPLIGAVIGFALGAMSGAQGNSDSHPGATVGAVVLIGGIGALIGAAVGSHIGGPYPFAHHRRIPPPAGKDEDLDRNTDSAAPPSDRPATVQSTEVSTALAR